MRESSKMVTWHELKLGQEVRSWEIGNSTHFCRAKVKSVNSTFVVLSVSDTREEAVYSKGTRFEVALTPKEFRAKWKDKAREVVEALQVDIPEYEAGHHEMANGWIDSDPFEMAAQLSRMQVKLVGVCRGILEKHSMFSGDILDIGLVVEDEHGDRWWCHWRTRSVADVINWWRGEPTEYIRPRDFEI